MSFSENKYNLPNPTGNIAPNNRRSHHSWISSRIPTGLRRRRRTEQPELVSGERSSQWWKIKLFSGMINDIKRRGPYYWSDWRDAWDYRVVPATIYMYFAKYESRFGLS
jgi:hypothetical protein